MSKRTADLSRRHKVWRDTDGVVTVTGGKLTTYRKMAEDTVDLVVTGLGPMRRRCITKNLQLEGSPGLDPTAKGSRTARSPSPSERAAHLDRRFGTRAASVLALADDRPELLEPIVAGLPYLGAEVLYATREEMALHVGDVLARRTRAAIQDARASASAAPTVAKLMGAELGWDDARQEAEVTDFLDLVTSELAAAGLEVKPDLEVAHGAGPGEPR